MGLGGAAHLISVGRHQSNQDGEDGRLRSRHPLPKTAVLDEASAMDRVLLFPVNTNETLTNAKLTSTILEDIVVLSIGRATEVAQNSSVDPKAWPSSDHAAGQVCERRPLASGGTRLNLFTRNPGGIGETRTQRRHPEPVPVSPRSEHWRHSSSLQARNVLQILG